MLFLGFARDLDGYHFLLLPQHHTSFAIPYPLLKPLHGCPEQLNQVADYEVEVGVGRGEGRRGGAAVRDGGGDGRDSGGGSVSEVRGGVGAGMLPPLLPYSNIGRGDHPYKIALALVWH